MDEMRDKCPELTLRKIPRANVQQAFVYNYIRQIDPRPDNVLCVGHFEDTVYHALLADGYNITGVDPCVNVLLHNHLKDGVYHSAYDLVFSVSVAEHVPDDEEFFNDICIATSPGGQGVITIDYSNKYVPGDPLPATCVRLYTSTDIHDRIIPILETKGCKIIGSIDYSGDPDFQWDNVTYCFATLVFARQQ
jgi:hypothetical protein